MVLNSKGYSKFHPLKEQAMEGGQGAGRRREGNRRGKGTCFGKYRLISNAERGKITLCAEASRGIWIPGAGLGRLLIHTRKLRQETSIGWVICSLEGTSQQAPEIKAHVRAHLLGRHVCTFLRFSSKFMGSGCEDAKAKGSLPRPKPVSLTF